MGFMCIATALFSVFRRQLNSWGSSMRCGPSGTVKAEVGNCRTTVYTSALARLADVPLASQVFPDSAKESAGDITKEREEELSFCTSLLFSKEVRVRALLSASPSVRPRC